MKIVYRSHSGAGLSAYRADRAKIVGAYKLIRRLLHDLLIQAFRVEPGAVHVEGGPQPGVINAIGVLFPTA